MCIIIANVSGMLSNQTLEESNRRNPDGAGLMFSINGQLFTYKDMDGQKIIDIYRRQRKAHPDTPMFLHFRIGTSGNRNKLNCHPFKIGRRTALMHNGILPEYDYPRSRLNDTQHFIADVLDHIPVEHIFGEAVKGRIEEIIGERNKLVILRHNGNWDIFNEELGHWDDDNWYSNYSYIPRPAGYTKKKHGWVLST